MRQSGTRFSSLEVEPHLAAFRLITTPSEWPEKLINFGDEVNNKPSFITIHI